MTVREYNLRMKGYLIKHLETERNIYLSAFIKRNVEATNQSGEYIYKDFKDFYDYDERKRKLLGDKPKQLDKTIVNRAKRVKELRDKGGINV
ncbi:TPA: hypothetical protein ACG5PZ_000018 [Streptococcus agalactiae]